MVFLAPFQQTAFEIRLLICYSVQIYVFAENSVLYKPLAVVITAVQIDGTDKRFEGIACHVTVMRLAY